jgi:hypothetical protein
LNVAERRSSSAWSAIFSETEYAALQGRREELMRAALFFFEHHRQLAAI